MHHATFHQIIRLALISGLLLAQGSCKDGRSRSVTDSGASDDAAHSDAGGDGTVYHDSGQNTSDSGQDSGLDTDGGTQNPCAGWTRLNLKFVGDFETGDTSGFTVSGNPSTITDSPVRVGAYALESSLDRFNDPVSYRTEVVPQEHPDAMVGDDMWYGFSIFLPDSYVPDSVWEIVAQWHGRPDFDIGEDWRNPPLALHTSDGVWTVSNIWDSKANTFESGERVYSGSRHFDLGAYVTGRWTDWVFHVKWSYESDGILQIWQDGVLVVDEPGPNTFNDERGPAFKMGIYKGWKHPEAQGNVDKRVLFHDELRIGNASATYCDVAPGTW